MRLIAPHASKYLYPVSDYDNFEFRSPVNPWQIQPEYRADFDKVKTMDVELREGQIIYIPAYWWCSMQFPETSTTVCCFKYRTYMNTLSVLDKLCMWLLQQQNVKRDAIEKKIAQPMQPMQSMQPNTEPMQPNTEPMQPNTEPMQPNTEPMQPNTEPMQPMQ
jgi:hypothetical protein